MMKSGSDFELRSVVEPWNDNRPVESVSREHSIAEHVPDVPVFLLL